MSIFPHPLLLVFFSFLLCPVASIPGGNGPPKEVKSGHCTSAELIKSAADCQAAAKALGLKDAKCVFVQHPIQDASDEQMKEKAEAVFSQVIAALTN